jgi:hypothetical protein
VSAVPNLPKRIDAAYIADRLTLEAEMFRGLLRTGCLTPNDAGKLAEDLGRFCLEAAAAVRSKSPAGGSSEEASSRSQYDEGSGRLPAEALFWD